MESISTFDIIKVKIGPSSSQTMEHWEAAFALTVPNSLPIGFLLSIAQANTGQVTISGSGGMVVSNRWNGNRTSGRWAKAGIDVRAASSSVLGGDAQ